MKESMSAIWEDNDYVYIPESLFELLPFEYREAIEEIKSIGSNVLCIADQDLQNLIRLSKAIPTTMSLSYIFYRLRSAKFDSTIEAFIEQEMLTTAFVVTYSRLFVTGNGVKGISRKVIPDHLKKVHDEIIDIRHRRYAHNGGHETIESGLEILHEESKFQVKMQLSLGFYVGGRNEWKELITFIDEYMHDMLYKTLARLTDKTGYEWIISTGETPDGIEKY